MNTDVNIDVGYLDDIKTFDGKAFDIIKESILWRVIRSFTLISLFVYSLLCLMFFLYQDRLIFNPSTEINQVPIQQQHSFNHFLVQTGEVGTVYGWYINSQENLGTVLYCRGSEGNVSYDLKKYEMWVSSGYNVVVFDYKGYGLSYGEPSEENFYESAEAVYRQLQSKGITSGSKFIIHGRAAGAAVAAKLASEHGCSGLIIESAFTNIRDLSHNKLPYLPTSILLRNEFPTKEYLQNADVPVLVMHSPEDEVVPYKMSRELFNAAPNTKKFFPLSGKHSTGYLFTDGYRNALKDFADGVNT